MNAAYNYEKNDWSIYYIFGCFTWMCRQSVWSRPNDQSSNLKNSDWKWCVGGPENNRLFMYKQKRERKKTQRSVCWPLLWSVWVARVKNYILKMFLILLLDYTFQFIYIHGTNKALENMDAGMQHPKYSCWKFRIPGFGQICWTLNSFYWHQHKKRYRNCNPVNVSAVIMARTGIR